MTELRTVRRVFVGVDGFAGFRYGCSYEVRYKKLPDGKVRLELDHAPELQKEVGRVTVRRDMFDRWWLLT